MTGRPTTGTGRHETSMDEQLMAEIAAVKRAVAILGAERQRLADRVASAEADRLAVDDAIGIVLVSLHKRIADRRAAAKLAGAAA